MSNLNDLINLAKADGGKFFVIDEAGEAKLVIMSVDDYQELLLGKLKRQVTDVEEINKEIIKAQLNEETVPQAVRSQIKSPTVTNYPRKESHNQTREEILRGEPPISKNDLRAEVIDPSFDFEGPKVEIDDL